MHKELLQTRFGTDWFFFFDFTFSNITVTPCIALGVVQDIVQTVRLGAEALIGR